MNARFKAKAAWWSSVALFAVWVVLLRAGVFA